MSRARLFVGLLSGRWQIPLGILAIAAVVLTVDRLRPVPRVIDFDLVLADLIALREGGKLRDAADVCANLLSMQPPLSSAQQAEVHDFLSDVAYRGELARPEPLASNAHVVIEHAEHAQRLGHHAGAARRLRMGKAREWLAQPDEAAAAYRSAIESAPTPSERRTALHALVRLLEGRPSGAAERAQRVAELLSDPGVSPDYLWSTLQSAIETALDDGDTAAAEALVANYAGQFARSDLEGYQHYLRARVLIAQERYLQAEPYVRAVDSWLSEHGIDPDMASAGLLPALNEVLRGQLSVVERRPQEALAAFERALSLDGFGRAFIAAAVGRAEALAALERHDTARECLAEAEQLIERRARGAAYGRARFGRALSMLAEQRRLAGDPLNAVAYLRQATTMLPADAPALRSGLYERLGDMAVLAAGAAQRSEAAPSLEQLTQLAGESYERAADSSGDEAARQAEMLWKSALQFERSGDFAAQRRVLTQFIAARGSDPRLPGALLRMAQACEASGDDKPALDWFDQLITYFPRIDEAPRARLMRAKLLLRRGGADGATAMVELEQLLESDAIGPQAAVYRDALRLLGAQHFAERTYSACIRRLEDFLMLYPDDADVDGTRFMLAEAYRRSAAALRESPPAGADPARVQATQRERLRRAAQLYLDCVPRDYAAADRGGQDVIARLALLNRGDCLLELNDADSLAEALATYRQVSARFQRHPAALVAQVRIADIHLRSGRVTEAARAVESARWLLRAIPDGAFGDEITATSRAEWDEYLTVVMQTRLFQDLFAAR